MKGYSVIFILGIFLFGLQSCDSVSKDRSGKDEHKHKGKGSQKLKIYAGYPGRNVEPFYSWNENDKKPIGIEPRLVEYILGQLNMDFEYVRDFSFDGKGDERITALKIESADIAIQGITITEARKADVLFSEPYYIDGLGVMVLDNSDLFDLDDLKGKKIFAYRFSTTYVWAKENLTESQILSQGDVTKFKHPTDLLIEGEIDAYLDDYGALKRMEENKGKTRLFPEKYTEEKYGIAISKKHPELVSKINEVLSKMKESGRLQDFVKGFER